MSTYTLANLIVGLRKALRLEVEGLKSFILLLTLMMVGGVSAQAQHPVLFNNIRVFDGEQVVPQTDVLIRGGVIDGVGRQLEAPGDAKVIDGRGKTLLPGLIDAHVHAFSAQTLEQALIFGVTTELDMFTDYRFADQMERAQARGNVTDRADIFSAGTLVTAPNGHGTQFGLDIPTITRPEQADAFVQARIDEGSDYIKVVLEDGSAYDLSYPALGEETLRAVVAAAHKRDMLVVTHVSTLKAAKTAVEAGTDGFAHVFVDAPPDDAIVRMAAERGVFVIATLAVHQIGEGADGGSISDDARLSPYLTDADVQGLQNPFPASGSASLTNGKRAVHALHAAGVPILAGTDAPNPGTAYGASLHRELVLLTESGLSPTEALAAATSVTADTFKLAHRGRIQEGSRADLLLVSGDPTRNITATRDIVGVWKGGVRADREGYRTALAAQREAAEAQVQTLAKAGVARVSDFETGEPTTAFGSGWEVSTDQLVGGGSDAEFVVTEGGARESAYALSISGETTPDVPFAWAGAMFYPGATPFAPAGLSSKSELTFWTKGDGGRYRVMVFCPEMGQVPPEQSFVAGPEWQQVSLALSEFGSCGEATGVQGVLFTAGTTPGRFTLQIDEVAFQ